MYSTVRENILSQGELCCLYQNGFSLFLYFAAPTSEKKFTIANLFKENPEQFAEF